MSDDRFEDLIRRAREEYNPPPEVPREAMWAAIERRREKDRAPSRRASRRARWVWVPAAAAAMLVFGILIGRLWVPGGPTGRVAEVTPGPRAVEEASDERSGGDVFRLAATRFLGRADAMLTQFRSETAATQTNGDLFYWADQLLRETRLLMDSPAAGNPDMERLFVDLELVLAQIVQISHNRETEDREWIEDDMQKRNLIARLRTQVPAGQ